MAETVDEWHRRYQEYRRSLGQQAADGGSWRRWISPRIGHLTWPQVARSRRAVESIRDDLDAAIGERRLGPGRGRLLPRSAHDIWQMLSTACKSARRCKRRDLRALEGKPNPCEDHEPPGQARTRTRSRRKPFIYPAEFVRLVSCKRVPREWREVYAMAAMTYLRPGELLVLEWGDVDLRNGLVHVTKAWNYTDEELKPPKTHAGLRDIPIARALLPLLRRMKAGAKDDELVAPQLSSVHRVTVPALMRRHLLVAGIDRRALHVSTELEHRAVFRSWRDTGLTWLAMTGLPITQMMRRAGHETPRTTVGYIKQAEDLTGRLGKPFGALPRELIAGRRRG